MERVSAQRQAGRGSRRGDRGAPPAPAGGGRRRSPGQQRCGAGQEGAVYSAARRRQRGAGSPRGGAAGPISRPGAPANPRCAQPPPPGLLQQPPSGLRPPHTGCRERAGGRLRAIPNPALRLRGGTFPCLHLSPLGCLSHVARRARVPLSAGRHGRLCLPPSGAPRAAGSPRRRHPAPRPGQPAAAVVGHQQAGRLPGKGAAGVRQGRAGSRAGSLRAVEARAASKPNSRANRR